MAGKVHRNLRNDEAFAGAFKNLGERNDQVRSRIMEIP